MSKKRSGKISRETKETKISLKLDVDGSGKNKISTGIPFFDHMLDLFSKHGGFNLEINAKGDIEVDLHHTVEDIGICLGQAFSKALGTKAGIKRFSSAKIPMDESLAEVVIDISGRPFLNYKVGFPKEEVKEFDKEVVKEFFQAFVNHAKMTLHIFLWEGENAHHIIEAIFKAFGVALSQACAISSKKGVPSTKGVI